MTPRERADRLFNRIMQASAQNDSAELAFFKPMAIQAYGLLGNLDPDARYHVGLIHAVTGDLDGLQAQLDSLRRGAPKHLLGSMLAFSAANLSGDDAGVTAAYRSFLRAYDEEMATGRREYEDHRPALEAFHDEALRGVGGSPPEAVNPASSPR